MKRSPSPSLTNFSGNLNEKRSVTNLAFKNLNKIAMFAPKTKPQANRNPNMNSNYFTNFDQNVKNSVIPRDPALNSNSKNMTPGTNNKKLKHLWSDFLEEFHGGEHADPGHSMRHSATQSIQNFTSNFSSSKKESHDPNLRYTKFFGYGK